MLLHKSPSGALFPYYYQNGELFGMHLGSYFSNEEGVIAIMQSEETFFTVRHRPMGVWIDFYDTDLTDKVIEAFVEMIEHMSPLVTKLALVGCSLLARWKLNRRIKRVASLACLPVKYFEDPEEAKTWLVSELE
jgi:hypothetical protein